MADSWQANPISEQARANDSIAERLQLLINETVIPDGFSEAAKAAPGQDFTWILIKSAIDEFKVAPPLRRQSDRVLAQPGMIDLLQNNPHLSG